MARKKRGEVIPPSDDIMTFLGGPKVVADSFRLGLGYESVSFDAVRRRANREWAERRECRFSLAVVTCLPGNSRHQ